jgi:pilus assembly protein CpaC
MHRTYSMSRIAVSIFAIGLPITLGSIVQAGDEPIPPPRPDSLTAPRAESFTPKGSTIIVPIGSTQRLQMKGKKPIQSVVNPREAIAVVQPVPDDPTTVVITGRSAGSTKITLTATDRTEEVYEVVVQFDVEYLRTVLTRAMPTANLNLIPGQNGVIIIGGTVAHAEDIDIIMRTALAVVDRKDLIVNAMRVGGVQQVQLDCIVAFVSRSAFRRMSFDFLDVGQHHNFSSTVGGALINPNIGTSLPSTPGIDLPVTNLIATPNGQPANFFLGVFNNEHAFFGLLQALRNESLAKILSEPKLVTLSGRSATMLSGGQQAIPEAAGLGSVAVTFVPFGTQLTFLPIVMQDGKIYLEVEPEISNIDPTVGTTISGTQVPGRNTQRVHTSVMIEDGQTLAIGGLIQNQVLANSQKVPVLGDLPFIGAAFRAIEYEEDERELVVMVTPHLVDPQSCDQVAKVLPSQETRTPDDFELFLEGILEAPRGKREVFPGGDYQPAYKASPSAGLYPCGPVGHQWDGQGGGVCAGPFGTRGCGTGACGTGTCGGTGACGSENCPAGTPGKFDVPAPMPAKSSAPAPAEGNRASLEGASPLPETKEARPFELPAATSDSGGSKQ